MTRNHQDAPKFKVESDWEEVGYDAFQFWAVHMMTGPNDWQYKEICRCNDESMAKLICDLLNKHCKE